MDANARRRVHQSVWGANLPGVHGLIPVSNFCSWAREFGQSREWADNRSLDWDQMQGWEANCIPGISALVGDLNRIYRSSPALHSQDTGSDGFTWIDADDAAGNVITTCGSDPTDRRWRVCSISRVAIAATTVSGCPGRNVDRALNTDSSAYTADAASAIWAAWWPTARRGTGNLYRRR